MCVNFEMEMEIQAGVCVCVFPAAEYKTLCPGGEGFRPNPITVILEGLFSRSNLNSAADAASALAVAF